MIRLQERDREILKVCYEQQFILTEHIRDHFFGGNYAEALRRTIELRNAGFLQSAGFKIGKQLAHILGHQGMPVAEERSLIRQRLYPKIDPLTAEHDAIVTDVRLRLQKLWTGEWTPEVGIKHFDKTQIPDGVFKFTNGGKAAIEVENSLKGRRRFENRLKLWPTSGVNMVLYIATNDEIYGHLQTFLAEAPMKPSCFLIGLEAFRSGATHVWNNHKGEVKLFTGAIQ